MTTKTIHIFKAGRHTAMSGRTLEFSESDLVRTAAAYNPGTHVAPLVLGHSGDDAPAYGQVQRLKAENGGLYADSRVGSELEKLVRDGKYLRVSSSFYGPSAPGNPVPGVWYLRHVGFLGAHPPAVKGLQAPAFADADDGCVSFLEDIVLPKPLPTDVDCVSYGEDPQRFHEAAQALMRSQPGISYAEAAGEVERRAVQRKASGGMTVEPDRNEAHEAILRMQRKQPGMSYAEAAGRHFSGR